MKKQDVTKLSDYELEYEQIKSKRIIKDAVIAAGILVVLYGIMIYQAISAL